MDKEKEIEGLAKTTCGYNGRKCNICYNYVDGTFVEKCPHHHLAKYLIEEGYRKAEEVRKETAKEILQKLYSNAERNCNLGGHCQEVIHIDDIIITAKEYGVEVDE